MRRPATDPYLLPDGLPRPLLRGHLHLGAFVVALALGVALVLVAGLQDAPAFAVYGLGVAGLFGVSAIYHRGRWRPGVRARLQRADHAMIFVLIAATYTPVCVYVLNGALGPALLAVVWTGALVAAALELRPTPAPRWVVVVLSIALGWVALTRAARRSRRARLGRDRADRPGRRALHGRCRDLRPSSAGPTARRLRLSRGLSRPHDRGRRVPLRGHRVLGPAAGLARRRDS